MIIDRQFSNEFVAAIREMINYSTVDEFIEWARISFNQPEWGTHLVNEEGHGPMTLIEWLETASEEDVYSYLWELKMEH